MQIYAHHLYSVPNFNGGTGYCAAGCREWFAAHGLSWADFVANGIAEAALAATGDELAHRVIEHAHAVAAAQEPQEQPHG